MDWLDPIEAGQIRNRVADVSAEANAISWSAGETRLLFAAAQDLAQIRLGAERTEPLRLLARHFPVAVGLAHITHAADPQTCRFVFWNLPAEFSGVLTQGQTAGLLAAIAGAIAPGIAWRDIDVLGSERHTHFAELVGRFGLGGAYGMLTARRQTGQDRELEYILLFWDIRSSGPTRREAALVGALLPFVANAIERTRQSLVSPDEPLGRNARQPGLALFGEDGTVIASNQRACDLASALDQSSATNSVHAALRRLAHRVGIPGGAGDRTPHRLATSLPERHCILDICAHSLLQVPHSSGTQLWVVELQEVDRASPMQNEAPPSFLQTLPPRQRQVATLLARTGLSYAEIAAQLGLAPGTVRKHAEWAFRRLGVNRRSELTAMMLAGSEPAVTQTGPRSQ